MFDFDEVEAKFSKLADDPAARTLPEIGASPWFGQYRRNPSARIRLYAVLGVGVPAASYTEWVSEESYKRFPGIEVCILELPGHADNPPPAFYDASKCAQEIASVVTRLQFKDQKMGDRKRPFALYGFSMGALLMWDAARQIHGQCDEGCKKLYVSSRGAPHLCSRGTEPPKEPPKRPDFSKLPIDQVHSWCMGSLQVDDAQKQKYDRWFQLLMKKDEQKLRDFAETMMCDQIMAGPGIPESAGDALPLKVECPIHFYHADADIVWPGQVGEGHSASIYSDLPGSWERYAPSSDKYGSTMFPGFSHGQMGAPDTPAFQHMMEDLSNLIATEALA